MEKKPFLIPVRSSEYRTVYRPAPDREAQTGTICRSWLCNDFTAVRAHGKLHLFGITHRRPEGFHSAFRYEDATVHLGENQLFHAVADLSSWKDATAGCFRDEPKVLGPDRRPGEPEGCWAPCIVRRGNRFFLFYTPGDMRVAVSGDLYQWTPLGSVFSGNGLTRDPFVWKENGLYTMVYVEHDLLFRTSRDLLHWSEPALFQKNPFVFLDPSCVSCQESPFLLRKNGIYYLFWCLYDGRNGCYDERTFVFASETLTGDWDHAPVAMLDGHATEVVRQGGRDYLLSVFYPHNGINLADLAWRTGGKPLSFQKR